MAAISRKASFSNDMDNLSDCWYMAPEDAASTRLVSYNYDYGAPEAYFSDAESDGQSSSQSEVDPYERSIYAHALTSVDTPYQPPAVNTTSLAYVETQSSCVADTSTSSLVNTGFLAPELAPASAHEGRRSTRALVSYREDESDAESDGNGTEDEYRPSPPPKPAKRRGGFSAKQTRAGVRRAPYPPSSNTSAASSPSPSSPSGSFNPRGFTHRNHEDTSPRSDIPDILTDESGALICPVEGCDHVLRPNPTDPKRKPRLPDMRRHVATHYPRLSEGKWVCRGYPLEIADRLRVPKRLIINVDGVPYRGGCGRGFSRKDALKRHLDKVGAQCRGDHTMRC
ncbi:hypothetical protein GLOTRDRAFT_129916 [Gloeophyllum trabeum ATCC 11539]|uniref:Uncharacterized protein n=1 Tax=Gloeophyllum trabeum (strain ATCC 11539 / FP-39264 / Madison 617) TaxID=670483 RepID=S7Q3K6_GLOTA|nr:uncharacterized protein GLOTRDRAFT_129916 [Gloeophyllum trabeum ATCC 11539]EPQ54566.1 hypothetical protein GLOTRDRAFT_129916 [Gloeophyllum trabeum ATCC 11539]